MKISDLQNLIILARNGLASVSKELDARQGAAAFASIAEVEAWVESLIEQQKGLQGEPNEDGQSVEVVEVSNEQIANVDEEEQTKNESVSE